MFVDACNDGGTRLPALRRRTLAEKRPHATRGAAGALPGLSTHLHAGSKRPAPQRAGQSTGARGLPGSHEHARHPAHLRGVLPDAHAVGGGKKSPPCPPSKTRFCPAKRATCSNSMSFGASYKARRRSAGCGARFVGAPAKSSPTRSATAAKKAPWPCRAHLPPDYRRRATRSDLWLAYEGVFPSRTHRFCGKEAGETNHAERWFGSLRARVSRLVRRAYSFSKSVERHFRRSPLLHRHPRPEDQAINTSLNTTRFPAGRVSTSRRLSCRTRVSAVPTPRRRVTAFLP